jgi:hypothetical protein
MLNALSLRNMEEFWSFGSRRLIVSLDKSTTLLNQGHEADLTAKSEFADMGLLVELLKHVLKTRLSTTRVLFSTNNASTYLHSPPSLPHNHLDYLGRHK